MNRLLVVCLATFGCTGEEAVVTCGEGTVLNATAAECLPAPSPGLICGAGTVERGGECVPDPERRFEIRLLDREISADRLQPVPVRVYGTNADGSPVIGEAILSIDRPGAGAFPKPRFELDGLGGVAHYRPCSSTEADCTGPVRFSVAMVDDPERVVATYDAELVALPIGSSAAACLAAPQLMFLDGEDQVYAGMLTVTDAGWGVTGADDRVRMRVEPNVETQGRFWRLEFSTERLGTPLLPGVYEGARRNGGGPQGMRPIMDINGAFSCPDLEGRFEVHDYEADDDGPRRALISFEQRCTGAARVLRGCVRYER
jgi:hypothetical protein